MLLRSNTRCAFPISKHRIYGKWNAIFSRADRCRSWRNLSHQLLHQMYILYWFFFSLPFPHLHHQYDGVESDHGQDGVLKRGRYHKMPQTILESVPILGHVTGQRFGTDGKIYAGPLKYKEEKKKRKMNETVKNTACSLTIHL